MRQDYQLPKDRRLQMRPNLKNIGTVLCFGGSQEERAKSLLFHMYQDICGWDYAEQLLAIAEDYTDSATLPSPTQQRCQ